MEKRFGNKTINQHMEQLLSVEGLFLQHDMKGLTPVYDVIKSTVRSLRSLGVSAEFHGLLHVLSVLLMTKLPSNLRLTTSRGGSRES